MNNLNLFYETSSKYTKHNCQYWEQEISVKRAGKKRQSEANVPDLGGNDSPDASSSQVEKNNPKGMTEIMQQKKRRRQMRNGGRRKGKGKGKQTTNLGESSYNSDMYINREIFTTKHE